jgi:tungstate transport system substrate-binding protein
VLRLATTTSTDNSGLLAAILPHFEKESRIKVHVIAVGTGKALRLGENGDVDVILVHARSREEAFVAAGHGVNRRDVMHNDFVILGPSRDPAGIRGMTSAAEAMRRIAESKSAFISRGDDSGTHIREKKLWKAAGIRPFEESWYLSAGRGMGSVLQMTDEKQGYTLSDRGTSLAFKGKVELEVLVEGDEVLFNPYGIIAVSPAKYPAVNYRGAMQLIAWFTSPRGQALIGAYELHGEVLFHPDAVAARRE